MFSFAIKFLLEGCLRVFLCYIINIPVCKSKIRILQYFLDNFDTNPTILFVNLTSWTSII